MAAGLGFKTFTTGEVLTAADTNGYLMQGILVFATEAARNSAITSPQEGQFAFTKDTNSLWYYTGSAWAASSGTGDIEGVTAGVGISGGGTSGTVTITNSMATEITAKADLIVGTGNAAFDNLPVGTNGHVLTADSTVSPTGLKWAAPAGGGKVLQVVYASTTTTVTLTSTSAYGDTGLSGAITPTLASSKVLIMTSQTRSIGTQALLASGTRILRGSSVIFTGGARSDFLADISGSVTPMYFINRFSLMYLDSPSTTSSVTYKTQGIMEFGNSQTFQDASTASTIILMEIGA